MRHPARLWVVVVCLGVVLSGCASIGIRPPEPSLAKAGSACDEYVAYFTYAQELQEAYHTRATHNRFWIYGAGVVGLGAAAASGGLAAVGAAGVGTLALLSISGGFSAAPFATIDNSTLAEIYTISATRVDDAMKDSHAQLPATLYASGNEAACKQALNDLRAKVSDARSRLEESRTNSAKAALERAAAQQQALKKLAAEIQDGEDFTLGVITDVSPASATPPALVTLRVLGARFETVLERDMKVTVSGQQVDVRSRVQTSTGEWSVTFLAPAAASSSKHDIELVVGKKRRPVPNPTQKKLDYR